MKHRIALVAFAVACALATAAEAAPPQSNVNARQANQQHRIAAGVANGQLTRREAAYLQHREADVRRVERRARADGYMSPSERARINRMLDANSRAIARQRGDGQYRWN